MLFAGSTLLASQTSNTFEKTFGGKENDVAKPWYVQTSAVR